MDLPTSAEVVIIGGGIMGCATAYQLARRGVSVVVFEKDSVAYGASGRNDGGVRAQWRMPSELPLAMASIQMFLALDEELGIKSEYRQGGNLMLAATEAELEKYGQEAEEQRRAGLNSWILDAQEVKEMVPVLKLPVAGARYCPTDGHCNPLSITTGYADAARRAGATIFEGVPVIGLTRRGDRVTGIVTSLGTVAAGMVVSCAGFLSNDIARMAGATLPITPTLHQVLVTEPLPHALDQFLMHLQEPLGVRQDLGGHFHFSGGSAGRQVGFDTTAELGTARILASRAVKFLPGLSGALAIRTWMGVYDVSPDLCPIIDYAPTVEGLLILTGFSGHGFALGPIVGKLTSELITDGRPSMPLDAFKLSRFESPNVRQVESVL